MKRKRKVILDKGNMGPAARRGLKGFEKLKDDQHN